jgi:hypothetical protein
VVRWIILAREAGSIAAALPPSYSPQKVGEDSQQSALFEPLRSGTDEVSA